LVYVFIHPFMTKSDREKSTLPHGQATVLTSVNHAQRFVNIGIAIDFSGNDRQVIQNAINQGGKLATYTFIHVVESAAAWYLGENSLDHETKSDERNLIQYQEKLAELGYNANQQIGFGNPAVEIARIVKERNLDL